MTEAMERNIEEYLVMLEQEERSVATRKQYERDIRSFFSFAGEEAITKEVVIRYKEELVGRCSPTSVNAKLAAINGFFSFLGKAEWRVRALKIQRKAFCPKEKELSENQYWKLVNTARKKGDIRLVLILETLCSTGIRISELPFITVQAIQMGEAVVQLKGKTRTVLISGKLKKSLKAYAKREKIREGSIFVTKTGKPMDRSNIWKKMKELCEEAGVDKEKVFPHNLRHLFARSFYRINKDLAKLADVLGHSNINTTRIYIITSGREHQECIDALGLAS